MAYRKVDEISLTTIADAIRAKAGTSGALAFPEGFAEAIAAIQAGGGDEGGVGTVMGRKYITGSLTLAEDVTGKVVLIENINNTELGTGDKILAYCFRETTTRSDNNGLWVSAYQYIKYSGGSSACGAAHGWSNTVSSAVKNYGIKASNGALVIVFNTSSLYGYAGETYTWIAFKYDEEE